jgi:exonuclease I
MKLVTLTVKIVFTIAITTKIYFEIAMTLKLKVAQIQSFDFVMVRRTRKNVSKLIDFILCTSRRLIPGK